MLRWPRLDAPGTLHHVMGRGIEGIKTFETGPIERIISGALTATIFGRFRSFLETRTWTARCSPPFSQSRSQRRTEPGSPVMMVSILSHGEPGETAEGLHHSQHLSVAKR